MGDCDTRGRESRNELNLLNPVSEQTENDIKDFDDILKIVGTNGKFQKLLLYGIICPITAIEPFITLNLIFLVFQPEHWCFIPGRDNSTNIDLWKASKIPVDLDRPVGPDGHHQYSQCTMYGINRSIEACSMGWEYDTSEYASTMATTFNWICDKHYVPTDTLTLQAIGNAVGTIIFGHMADKLGRKPLFFLTYSISIVFRFIGFFVGDRIWLFLLTQFLSGTSFPVMFITPSMIVAENSDNDYRAWVYAVTWMVWVVGMALLPLIVWLSREWFLIGLLTTLPGLVILAYWPFLPESPRWLFSTGKLEQCSKILMHAAKLNGRESRITKPQMDALLQRLSRSGQFKSDGVVGVWTLFKSKRLAINTTLITFCWSLNIIIYYGIILNTTHMTGNQFLNFFLLSIIELPSGYIGGVLVDKMGRRWTPSAFFALCGLSCCAAALSIWEIFNAVVAKFSITLTFLVVYLQGAEIFPTQLRSSGCGFSSTIGAICGILCPIMVALGTYHYSYPYWIMSALSFLGMITCAFLPETLNQNLPETIEDAEQFGKDIKFWTFLPAPTNAEKSKGNINVSKG